MLTPSVSQVSQPVVENAVRHTAAIISGNIDVAIDIRVCDNTLILLGNDNGRGIEDVYLQRIRNGWECRVDWIKNSIGLAHVH